MDLTGLRERVLPPVVDTAFVAAFTAAAKVDAVLITPERPHWPAGFADLGVSAPHALWARGNTALLVAQPSIAVVGARAATGYGEHVCMDIVGGLVGRGHTIVSGAAYGIDGMAHRAALASDGHTVAYLAGGVDRFYPTGHDALLTRIATNGVVASEMACGSAPTKWRFLMRNRLIAAVARATVITEAGWRSGALNIAAHALGINRPVGAVPGLVTSPASAGCHRLIREYGAQLVTNAEDAAAL
ncbi:DNA-processing protein DprA [Cryobacterium sp. Y62]|uniref:DNA-processing protein DprA n=1 Tax=Cryobacterium sp. Y62 TaxID=2048284 RepID=UPI001E4250B4|nr:DNA-processing protein DprA [Cryobacterium sp. Y62]